MSVLYRIPRPGAAWESVAIIGTTESGYLGAVP